MTLLRFLDIERCGQQTFARCSSASRTRTRPVVRPNDNDVSRKKEEMLEENYNNTFTHNIVNGTAHKVKMRRIAALEKA